MWIIFAVLSALCLGFYDVSKKQSLLQNEVVPVLFYSVLISSLLLLPFLLVSRLAPAYWAGSVLYVPFVGLYTHVLIFLKATLVLSSWLFGYIAMKHLPLTLVSPINATRPIWTLLGAVLLLHESLNGWQSAGVACVLLSFFAFSLVGKKENGSLKSNSYLFFLFLATLLGACSGLYDKHLMRTIDHNAVQVFYTFYQTLLMAVVYVVCYWKKKKPVIRQWGWVIAISVFLVLSDFVYLLALSDSASLISVVSTVRRVGVIIPFVYGALVFKDKNVLVKSICLCGVLLGMVFLLLGTI